MRKRLSLFVLCTLLVAAVFPVQAFAAEPVKIEVTGVPAALYVGADVPTSQTITVTVDGKAARINYVGMQPIKGSEYDPTGYLEGGKITKAGDYAININISNARAQAFGVSSVTVNGAPAAEFGSFAQVVDSFVEDGETFYALSVKPSEYTAREIKALRESGEIYVDTYLPYDSTLGIKCFIHVTETKPVEEKPVDTGLPFTDVSAGDWYLKFLKSAYESGIVGGTSANKYTPAGNLTHAQIMVMVANLHSKQKGDNYDFQANKKTGDAWYQVFEDYCVAEGIIPAETFTDPGLFKGQENANVNRGQMAFYFAHALTEDSYKDKQSVSLGDIEGHVFAADIERLAKANIVGGYADGTFKPGNLVTRAEASVFISNILDAMSE